MAAAKKSAEITIPPRREVDEFAESMRAAAQKDLELIKSFEIETPAEYEFACNALKEIASKRDIVDAKRKSWVEGLKAITKDIDATFKPALDLRKETEALLKEMIGAYVIANEQKRAALLKEAAASAKRDPDAAEAAIAEAAAFLAPEAKGGTGVTTFWTGEVLDAALIPREYLMPDVKKLEAMTKALGKDPLIPGWRAFPDAAVRTSRKGG